MGMDEDLRTENKGLREAVERQAREIVIFEDKIQILNGDIYRLKVALRNIADTLVGEVKE